MAQIKSAPDLTQYLQTNNVDLAFDESLLPPHDSPFNKPIPLKSGKTIGNSLCILPMEGWDGTPDGKPTDFTRNRWVKFAESGAKLLFGCEAVAVCHDGKANPNQLVMNDDNFDSFVGLRQLILDKPEVRDARRLPDPDRRRYRQDHSALRRRGYPGATGRVRLCRY
jgi:NADPH2 dehydrogenase